MIKLIIYLILNISSFLEEISSIIKKQDSPRKNENYWRTIRSWIKNNSPKHLNNFLKMLIILWNRNNSTFCLLVLLEIKTWIENLSYLYSYKLQPLYLVYILTRVGGNGNLESWKLCITSCFKQYERRKDKVFKP